MSSTFRDVEQHLAKCREGFLSKDYSVAMVADLVMEMELWDTDIPFVEGLRSLDVFDFKEEELVCFVLLCDHIITDGLCAIDYSWYSDHPDYNRILEGKEGLIKRGIIRRFGQTGDNSQRASEQVSRYLPTPHAFGKLFYGKKNLISLDSLTKQAELVAVSTIQKKELFFSDVNKDEVKRLFMLMDKNRFIGIMDRLRAKGRKASASCLFYGSPGTGKTELARQLALATGRDIMIADASKLFSSWHGDTEKNVREMFDAYRYIQSISVDAPIMLFNEADGILGKRSGLMRQAVDKIENRVQNILLQELEDFEGILIATTNMTDNIDAAFERRFLFKINFQVPDTGTRAKIWQSMIPDVEIREAMILASRYAFSGGQIDNIAKKRDIDEALFDEKPTFEEMLNYCDNELIASVGGKGIEKIDFSKSFFSLGGTVN